MESLYVHIKDLKDAKQQYVIEKKADVNRVSIDQLLHFFNHFKIARGHSKTRKNRRDQHLYEAVKLTDRMIRQAFFLSKMTVVDERENGQLEHTHLRRVEFLEFIGRLADLFFETTSQHYEWRLDQKMVVILQWMFEPFNLHFVMPQFPDEYLSESDDDYGEETDEEEEKKTN